MAAVAAPMLVISLLAAAFLLRVDAARAPLAWFADARLDLRRLLRRSRSPSTCSSSSRESAATGSNLDANERRRIQIVVVYSGVPAVFAYAIKAGVPLLSSLAGRTVELPWLIEGALQALVLMPAVALPYAVAVKHIFSPRTVVRRGLQYALARRTLSVLAALPVAVLAVLAAQRTRSAARRHRAGAAVVLRHQPRAGGASDSATASRRSAGSTSSSSVRSTTRARSWSSLANRVPLETDPAQLVALVLSQIDNALAAGIDRGARR